MRAPTLNRSLLALLALGILPLATHGGQAECCNVTGSLASTATGPVNGDEAFFKLPTGPANVMFLLDTSGSMQQLPPCGDRGWNSTTACTTPRVTAPSDPNSNGTGMPKTYYAATGTCTPTTLTTPSGTSSPLAWMERVVPSRTLADPGRSNALVTDKPPWGNGCVGNACLFDPDAYFFYGDWRASSTGASSTRRASDTDATLPGGCLFLDNNGVAPRDKGGNFVDLGADCRTCMANRGFYFYSVKYWDASNNLRSGSGLLFKGTFLNAFPPKFVSAKKVIKDVAFMDPASPSKLDQVRLGLTILNASRSDPQRADLIVPLGPDKSGAFPPTQAGFAQARQYILSILNYDRTVYRDAAGNVICDGAALTGFFNPASTSTPLGSALFNIGQYFSSAGRYDALLGTGFQTSAFVESSAGLANAPWARSNPNQCSVCWACQNNAVVVVTDGAPNNEIDFPSAITGYDTPGYTAAANCGANGTACNSAVLPRVADWIHSIDLRADAVMSGKQALAVHMIGINIDRATTPTAAATMQAAANLGGGMFQSASDPASLAAAVVNAINSVVPKENSFSAASATSLQTVQTAAAQAFLTRFKPNQSPTWEGHVYETFLFNEGLNGCDPSAVTQPTVTCQGKPVSADFNGDGKCDGLFMIDSECDEIAEDPATGDFVKRGLALPAKVAWDAGKVLSDPTQTGYRSADESSTRARNIFTYVNGAKVPFTTANAATLLPFMNVTSNWCTGFLTQIGVPAGTSPTLTCAEQIIHFVRGWDVLDQDTDGCAGPGNPKNTSSCKSGLKGEERDRANDGPPGCTFGTNCTPSPIFWKLGDVFHSTPAVVLAPVDEFRCDSGFENQCVATVHSPKGISGQTEIASYTLPSGRTVDAYDRYRLDNLARKRVVLAGANDGMLHAFDAGAADTSQPADPTGSFPYTVGTGEELWGFIPQDLLPRLKDLTAAHQYMVDGSIMLRDVWVDGSGTEITTANRKKERDEFHTLAIFGRRSGGNMYSALDVTDPLNPTLRWSFPEPCSENAWYMGQSWADFAPRPPPIGPVRMASTVDPRGFEERWIVMINGGYDPMLNQGRAVFMVDAWTGGTLWRFTDADFKAQQGYGAVTSMFPVPAAIGLVDIGDTTSPVKDADGFFDTATWGDLGGNLWVARFHAPGVIDSTTGRVNNWFAARTFEQRRQLDDSQRAAGRNEFFYMTANAWESSTHTLRTLLGSGNREQIMKQSSTCGTNDLLGCCQAGCTNVTAQSTVSNGSCSGTTAFSCVNGVLSFASPATTCGETATCAAAPGNAFTANHNVHWECPGAGTVADAAGSASFDASGVGTVTPMPERKVVGTFAAPSHNRFYGVWAYGKEAAKMFADLTTARAFDRNRFTDDPSFAGSCAGPTGGTCTLVETTSARVTLSGTTCGTGVTKCSAGSSDAGWFYQYGEVCPLESCTPAPPWTDEKTGGGATVMFGCAIWGGFRPVGATTSTSPCSGSLGVPASYGYVTHYVSGTPDANNCGGGTTGIIPFARQRAVTAPPNAPIIMVDVVPPAPPAGPTPPGPPGGGESDCGGGKIVYSAARMDPGSPASKDQLATRSCAVESMYWLEVPRDLHACRHVPNSNACR